MFFKLFKLCLLLALTVGVLALNPISTFAASKVMWGKTELKPGQLGKVTIVSNTTLWKLEKDSTLVKVRDLKKGEEYRVYSYKSNHAGLYGVGGGAFIQKSNAIKYDTPSKSKLSLLEKLEKNKPVEEQAKLDPIPVLIEAINGTENIFYIQEDESLNQRLLVYNKVTGKNAYIPINHKELKNGGMYYQKVIKDYAFIQNYDENGKKSTYRLSLQPPYKIDKVFEEIQDFVVYNNKLYFFNQKNIDPVTQKVNLMTSDLDGRNQEVFASFEKGYSATIFSYSNGQITIPYVENGRVFKLDNFDLKTKEKLMVDKQLVTIAGANPSLGTIFGVHRESSVRDSITEIYSATQKIAEVQMEGKNISFISHFNGAVYITSLDNKYKTHLYKIEDKKLKYMETSKGEMIWLEGNKYYYFDESNKRIKVKQF